MEIVDRALWVGKECAIRIQRRWYVWAFALIAPLVITHFVSISLNVTESLPQTLFIVVKGEKPAKGDFAAFRWHGGGPYKEGVTFVKIIAGAGGDRVDAVDREYRVNGKTVGVAKTHSRTGVPLEPGPVGIIPDGSYYMMATHKDSLDSRYRLTGWINDSEIIGKAYALF